VHKEDTSVKFLSFVDVVPKQFQYPTKEQLYSSLNTAATHEFSLETTKTEYGHGLNIILTELQD